MCTCITYINTHYTTCTHVLHTLIHTISTTLHVHEYTSLGNYQVVTQHRGKLAFRSQGIWTNNSGSYIVHVQCIRLDVRHNTCTHKELRNIHVNIVFLFRNKTESDNSHIKREQCMYCRRYNTIMSHFNTQNQHMKHNKTIN